PRSARPLTLRVPELLPGGGRAVLGDALELTPTLGPFDLAYVDPPYNQHRYFTNYHVWETLVAWDAPEAYGVARKRIDSRDPSTRSAFNSKRTMPDALRRVVRDLDCRLLVLSYNDEAWLNAEELEAVCREGGGGGAGGGRGGAAGTGWAGEREVVTLSFDSARYVGAQIGIHNPAGDKVGQVSHLSNHELLVIAGEGDLVRHVVDQVREAETEPAADGSTRSSAGVASGLMADRLQ
ncbi:MAG TPA: DNA adenine methylase, partial [Acidimicrobiales bacterium]|nr:DNA adenine methylase [Acidimicrobiales bacterium]